MLLYNYAKIKGVKKRKEFVFLLLVAVHVLPSLIIPTSIVKAETAVFFEDGFESNNLRAWDNTATSYRDTVTARGYSPYRGNYHAVFKIDGSGSSDKAFLIENVNEAEIIVSGYFNPSNGLPLRDNGDRFFTIRLLGNGQTLASVGIKKINGVDKWILTGRDGTSWKGGKQSTSPAIRPKWYKIELHWVKSSSNGLVELFIDGNKILSYTNLDTDNYGNVDKVNIGLINCVGIQQDITLYGDLVKMSTTEGTNEPTSTSTQSQSGSTDTSSEQTGSTSPTYSSTTSKKLPYLAGAVFTPQWDISSSVPESNKHVREAMFRNMDQSGANLVVIAINSELYSNPKHNNAKYRDSLDTYVRWANKHDLFYIFKLQSVGEKKSFSGPGSNYKLAEAPAYRARAVSMWVDLAKKYGTDNNFIGFTLLNEPYNRRDYSKWNVVIDYYYECIDSVVPVDPDCVFFVMEPYKWGSQLSEWRQQGYIKRKNVVYEYHLYYHSQVTGSPWGINYARGSFNTAYNEFVKYHKEKILVAQNDGYQVFCGEFGIYGIPEDNNRMDPNYARAHIDQMKIMKQFGIHFAQWRMRALGQAWSMGSSDGSRLNSAGRLWADNLPTGLVKP